MCDVCLFVNNAVVGSLLDQSEFSEPVPGYSVSIFCAFCLEILQTMISHMEVEISIQMFSWRKWNFQSEPRVGLFQEVAP